MKWIMPRLIDLNAIKQAAGQCKDGTGGDPYCQGGAAPTGNNCLVGTSANVCVAGDGPG